MDTIDTTTLTTTHPGDPDGEIPMIGYIRVSTAREDMISPELQADAIHRWATRNNRRITTWYADLDMSGRRFDNRKIATCIERVQDGFEREVGVWKYNRWGRNRALNALNLAHLEKVGGALQSATEDVDATTSVGRFTRGMLMELAAFESDRIAEGWRDVQAQRVANGLPSGGRTRFGYIRKGKIHNGDRWVHDPTDPLGERYEPHPQLGPILAEMFSRYVHGDYFYDICDWLTRQGIKPPGGGRWLVESVRRMLDSGWGAGLLIVHNPICTNHPEKGHCKNQIFMDGAHQAVIDEPTWQAYLERRRNQKQAPPKARGARYPLSGVIRCGHCGHKHGHSISSSGTSHWRCGGSLYKLCESSRSVSDAAVTAAVLEVLQYDAADIETAAGVHHVTPPTPPGPADTLPKIDAELSKISDALVSLAEKYVEGEIGKPEHDTLKTRYTKRRSELKRRRTELEQEAASQPEDPTVYVPVLRGLVEEWDTLPVTHRNTMLKRFLSVEAFRESRTQAWVVIRTSYGTEHRFDVATRPGPSPKTGVALYAPWRTPTS